MRINYSTLVFLVTMFRSYRSIDSHCEALSPPEFGYILGTQRSCNDTVSYRCNYGYLLNGPDHRKCRSDGEWTGATPICLPFNSCGQAGFTSDTVLPKRVQKVVEGQIAPLGAWPWHAMLVHNNKNRIYESMHSLLGGATIISKKWILSSAHLFDGYKTNEPSFWLRRVLIVVGISRVPNKNETLPPEMQVYQPRRVLRHPKFNSLNYDYDISLIQIGSRMMPTKRGIFFSSGCSISDGLSLGMYVRPVCLPCINDQQFLSEPQTHTHVRFVTYGAGNCETRKSSLRESPAVVVGFGDKHPKSKNVLFLRRSEVLRHGFLRILPKKECAEGVRKIQQKWKAGRLTERMLCAKGDNISNLMDACMGDSGGPLLQRAQSPSGHYYWIQVGVVSWGWGCANTDSDGYTYPGFYTNVTYVVEWILDSMKKVQSEEQPETTNGRMVDAYVRVNTEETRHKFSFALNSTINQVKQEIENALGFPSNRQIIFYNKCRLLGNNTLQSYRFRSGRWLFVFYYRRP